MRDIKFRLPHYYTNNNKFAYFTQWGRVSECMYDFISPANSNQTYIKQDEQYTGLKDKNEKDIYQGDIVKDFCGWIRVVVFYEGIYFLKSVEDSWSEFIEKDVDVDEGDMYFLNKRRAVGSEIIGNIHENLELL